LNQFTDFQSNEQLYSLLIKMHNGLILENVKNTILSKGDFISVDELQSIQTKDKDFKRLYSREPFPTAELIKIYNALSESLKGTWQYENYEMEINY